MYMTNVPLFFYPHLITGDDLISYKLTSKTAKAKNLTHGNEKRRFSYLWKHNTDMKRPIVKVMGVSRGGHCRELLFWYPSLKVSVIHLLIKHLKTDASDCTQKRISWNELTKPKGATICAVTPWRTERYSLLVYLIPLYIWLANNTYLFLWFQIHGWHHYNTPMHSGK